MYSHPQQQRKRPPPPAASAAAGLRSRSSSRRDAAPPPPDDKARRRRRRNALRRVREIEAEAASRTLSGDGRSPDLPPLPDGDGEGEGGMAASSSSLGTLFGHPYGALPHGNSLSDPEPGNDVRRSGLGVLCVLNDEQILSVASFLPGPDLGRLVRTSRFWYVAGHHEELWRDLTLRAYGDGGFDFRNGWRDTYVLRTCRIRDGGAGGILGGEDDTNSDGGGGNGEKAGPSSPSPPPLSDVPPDNLHPSGPKSAPAPASGRTSDEDEDDGPSSPAALLPPSFRTHRPIKVAGIYSDTMYRSWLCRSFALQPSWLSVESVPREDASSLSTERFLSEYEDRNRPVVLVGASSNWPAVRLWSRDYLIEQTRGATFRATSGAAPLPATFALDSYAAYCDSAAEEAPLYLFDRTFDTSVPQLLRDYDPALRRTCPYFDPAAPHGHDLFGLLGKVRRPDHRWIIVGPKRSGSAFHIDPNCTHAWNAPILGRKRWIFYPPGVDPPGVFPSPSGDDVTMPISIGEWFLTYWPDHVRRRSDPDPSRRPLECTVRPGDVLFVPHGWWHTVLNLDDGLSVALTQNYVSRSNLGDVLRFLEKKPGQISGCRDREEAVRPERLLDEFRAKLGDSRPDLLEEAERAAAGGWSCGAWTDGGDGKEEVEEDGEPGAPEETRSKKLKLLPGGGEAGSRSEGRSILDRAKCPSSNSREQGQESTRNGGQGGFSFSFL